MFGAVTRLEPNRIEPDGHADAAWRCAGSWQTFAATAGTVGVAASVAAAALLVDPDPLADWRCCANTRGAARSATAVSTQRGLENLPRLIISSV